MGKDSAASQTAAASVLLYEDYDLIHRLVRDEFTPDVARFVADDGGVYKTVLELLNSSRRP